MSWPTFPADLVALQDSLAIALPDQWHPGVDAVAVGGVFVCFGRGGTGPGAEGDVGWSAAAVIRDGRVVARAGVMGSAGGPYRPGFLAVREGRLLEEAVKALAEAPDVVLVNATGRDHPRSAGLALHLGAVLDLPTVGVTHRPLLAVGDWPSSGRPGSFAPLRVGEDVVGYWVRTQEDRRPLAVHAGWRTTPETACAVVLGSVLESRTPEPLREARRLARIARHRGTPSR
jgi:deoxyribonuclease V